MDKIDVEFKNSGTGMYSPWHLDIAHKHNVKLIVTCDIGHFVKIGDDIYKIIRPYDAYRLYDYFKTLEEAFSIRKGIARPVFAAIRNG